MCIRDRRERLWNTVRDCETLCERLWNIVCKTVKQCARDRETLCVRLWNIVWETVKHCVRDCETSSDWLWNIVCNTVKHCVRDCETSCERLWNIVWETVKHCERLWIIVRKTVKHCVRDCETSCVRLWNIVWETVNIEWETVKHCVRDCETLCERLWNIVCLMCTVGSGLCQRWTTHLYLTTWTSRSSSVWPDVQLRNLSFSRLQSEAESLIRKVSHFVSWPSTAELDIVYRPPNQCHEVCMLLCMFPPFSSIFILSHFICCLLYRLRSIVIRVIQSHYCKFEINTYLLTYIDNKWKCMDVV